MADYSPDLPFEFVTSSSGYFKKPEKKDKMTQKEKLSKLLFKRLANFTSRATKEEKEAKRKQKNKKKYATITKPVIKSLSFTDKPQANLRMTNTDQWEYHINEQRNSAPREKQFKLSNFDQYMMPASSSFSNITEAKDSDGESDDETSSSFSDSSSSSSSSCDDSDENLSAKSSHLNLASIAQSNSESPATSSRKGSRSSLTNNLSAKSSHMYLSTLRSRSATAILQTTNTTGVTCTNDDSPFRTHFPFLKKLPGFRAKVKPDDKDGTGTGCGTGVLRYNFIYGYICYLFLRRASNKDEGKKYKNQEQQTVLRSISSIEFSRNEVMMATAKWKDFVNKKQSSTTGSSSNHRFKLTDHDRLLLSQSKLKNNLNFRPSYLNQTKSSLINTAASSMSPWSSRNALDDVDEDSDDNQVQNNEPKLGFIAETVLDFWYLVFDLIVGYMLK